MGAQELSSLDGFKKGDYAVISDPRTQNEFGTDRIRFKIESVRTYINVKDEVKLTAYILDSDEEESIMLAIIEESGFYSIYLYFNDPDGASSAFNESDEDEVEEEKSATINYGNLVYPDKNEFADMIVILSKYGHQMKEVHWIKKGLSHVNLAYYEEGNVDEASFCEYFTEDDNFGNDLALVTCMGPMDKGKIDIWYGYDIQDKEVELFEAEDDDYNGDLEL